MENANIDFAAMSNPSLLQLMGNYVKENRLRQNKTQEEIATIAGINRTTLVSIENGNGGTLLTWVQLMRALDQLHFFKNFQLASQVSPIKLAKLELKKRLRSRKKGKPNNNQKKSDW